MMCPRCIRRLTAGGIHTCTPSEGWRKLEEERDALKASNEALKKQIEELKRQRVQRAGEICYRLGINAPGEDADKNWSEVLDDMVNQLVLKEWGHLSHSPICQAVNCEATRDIAVCGLSTPSDTSALDAVVEEAKREAIERACSAVTPMFGVVRGAEVCEAIRRSIP